MPRLPTNAPAHRLPRAFRPNGQALAPFSGELWLPTLSFDPWGAEFQQAQPLVEDAIGEGVDHGHLDSGIAPIAYCVRRCMCEFIEIGNDVLPLRNRMSKIMIPTESTLPGFVEDPVVQGALKRAAASRAKAVVT